MTTFAIRARLRLQQHRANHGLSVADVAKALNISHTHAHRCLHGTIDVVKLDTVERIAALIGIEPHEVVAPMSSDAAASNGNATEYAA